MNEKMHALSHCTNVTKHAIIFYLENLHKNIPKRMVNSIFPLNDEVLFTIINTK